MKPITIKGSTGPIVYTRIGDGPPLILVAGMGSTRRVWGELPAMLSRQFTMVTVDNRGVGGSRAGDSFTLAGAADDLCRILDHLKLERAALLGASLGGLIVLRTALHAPRRVTSMVLLSCAAHLSTHGRRTLQVMRAIFRALPPGEAGGALMSLAFAPPFHERFPGFVDEAARLYGPDPDDIPGTLAQLDHMLEGWDLRKQLGGLRIPSLVIAGLRDAIVASEDTCAIAEALPQARLLEVPDAAHAVLAEGGAEVLREVVEFLSKHST